MAFPRKLKELCSPAFLYFILSIFGILVSVFQNLGNKHMYTLGYISTPVSSTLLVFIVKIIYVLFWTWILNLMCKDGHREIAWFLVLLPFVLFFILIFTMGRSGMEGFSNYNPFHKETKKFLKGTKPVADYGKSQVDHYASLGNVTTWKMIGNDNKQRTVWVPAFVKPAKQAEKEYNNSIEKGIEKGLEKAEDEAEKGLEKAGNTIAGWFS